MDGEFLNGPSERHKGGGVTAGDPAPKSYSEVFEELVPYYLTIGMSLDDYWNGDPQIAKWYRKADKLKQDRVNERLWLQGMYVYEAIADLAPILQAFAKKGTKASPYPDKPYSLRGDEDKSEFEVKHEEKRKEKEGLDYMEAFMMAHNARFKKENKPKVGAEGTKEVTADGGVGQLDDQDIGGHE